MHSRDRGAAAPNEGELVAWFRRNGRKLDMAVFGTAIITLSLFATQLLRGAVQ